MKTLLGTIIVVATTLAQADDYDAYDSYKRLYANEPSLTEKYAPRTDPAYPTPMMPSLTRDYDRIPPPGGYNLVTPRSLCHSDGSNTFCFDR